MINQFVTFCAIMILVGCGRAMPIAINRNDLVNDKNTIYWVKIGCDENGRMIYKRVDGELYEVGNPLRDKMVFKWKVESLYLINMKTGSDINVRSGVCLSLMNNGEFVERDNGEWHRRMVIFNENGKARVNPIGYNDPFMKTSAQQVDSAEASTIAVPPSDPSGSPR